MDILLIAVTGFMNIACFFIGAKVGQKVVKGETIEAPKLNPIEAIRERQDKKAEKEEQNKIEAIMRNIEKYDGTSKGQEDIPK